MKIKFHNEPRGFAEGGEVRDPISGNEVPAGALPHEVRDDVDAKLSEGEFVVPADVVRYVGLDKLMQMRDEAKGGLARMEAEGQIGGTTPTDDLDFIIDSLDADDLDDRVKHFAEGGDVSQFVGAHKQVTGVEADEPTFIEHRTYTNASGDIKYIPFLRGKPLTEVPMGYYPYYAEGEVGAVRGAAGVTEGAAPTDSGPRQLTEEQQAWDDILGSGRYSDANEAIQQHYMLKSDSLNRDRLANMENLVGTMDVETEDVEGYLMSQMTPAALELYYDRATDPRGLDAFFLKDYSTEERLIWAQRTAGTIRRNAGLPDESLVNPDVAQAFIGETPTMATFGANLKKMFGSSPTFQILSGIASSLFGHLSEDEALAKAAETPEGKAAVASANQAAEEAAGNTTDIQMAATTDPASPSNSITTQFSEAKQALTESTASRVKLESDIEVLNNSITTMEAQGITDQGLIGALQGQLNIKETELDSLEGDHSELQGTYNTLQNWQTNLEETAAAVGMTADELFNFGEDALTNGLPAADPAPATTAITGLTGETGVEVSAAPAANIIDVTNQEEEEPLFAQPVVYTPTPVEQEALDALEADVAPPTPAPTVTPPPTVTSSGGTGTDTSFTSGGVFEEEDDDWINQMEAEFEEEDAATVTSGTGSGIKTGTGQTVNIGSSSSNNNSSSSSSSTSKEGTYCCTKMVKHGNWTSMKKLYRMHKWHNAQAQWWKDGYDVWGRTLADTFLNGEGTFWPSIMEAFYQRHVNGGKLTAKSVLANLMVYPGVAVHGAIAALKNKHVDEVDLAYVAEQTKS